MATLASLSNILRAELGDTARSFVDTFTGDAVTTRYQLNQAPVQGETLVVKVTVGSTTTDVSSTAIIEEGTGVLTLAAAPASGAVVTVVGTAYRYFTDSEICYYINTAFAEHGRTSTDSNGSLVTLSTLPVVEEYPVVILASTLALYTLATDASFDIDIISPDGVSIPRSERYRQLSEIIQQRKEQYRELCVLLNIGLHRIETFNLRRISRTTNRYVPIYRPQEVDDGSIPVRVALSMPTYGDVTPLTTAQAKDLTVYAGDDFAAPVLFSFDITNYTPLAQVRLYPSLPGSMVGPVIVGTFTFTKSASTTGGAVDLLTMKLAGSVTTSFPNISYYDLQLTAPDGSVKTYIYGKVFTHAQVSNPLGPF
ncbi:hypothetical protein UFOVP27_112 [uncultured Caudovirales phage]|uniref:Uncharacterized protein n=1 Tax=uncultured Caudovirales phage TaxID=2100421 RepID=A0A6J5KJB1_9CAUD|nr:hypothetical protein UFOVP27_112 [uncultured Caudovirales phage]